MSALPVSTFPLDQIQDNPYQPRIVDDLEHIEKLARSIAADGLLQSPRARRNGHGFQLAFGHSRRKAFEWLQANYQAQELPNRYGGYSSMPLDIVELSDEEMYRHAVSENVQRKDLSPIELAQAMIKYRDEFKKSSEEVGQLFGMNGATVRGLVRLLDLPQDIQDKVASGEITQGAARKLLTIARVDQGQIQQAVDNITSGMSADEAVDGAMRDSDKAFMMWFGWRSGKPLAGEGLWAIDLPSEKFPMKHLPELKAADALKALDIKEGFMLDRVKLWIDCLVTGTCKGPDGIAEYPEPGDTVADHLIKYGAPADVIEKLALLITPPGCSACPLHSVSDKQHFCGFKPCHKRKRAAWMASDVEKVSKRLKIAAYDPEQDGKTVLALNENSYQDEYKRHAELVKKQDPNLRVQTHYSEYSEHKWTASYLCRLILVGDGAKAQKERVQKAKAAEKTREDDRDRQWESQRKRRDASDTFQEKVANPAFAVAFKEMTNLPVMAALVGAVPPQKGDKKAELLNVLRIRLADHALDNMIGWNKKQEGPVAVAKHLQGVATTWGIKLPADFLDVAKKFEPAIAAETKKGKKK